MHRARLALAGLLIAIGSCTQPSGPLVGHWVETTAPGRHLILRADGSFTNSGADWRHEGGYLVNGSSITFSPQRFVSWEGVQDPSPYTSLFDNCVYEFDGNELVFHYTTYPADAPVPTTMRFRRD